ncbi:MAG: L,D-transpeptidase family protein, partial [Oceanobacter sp.]
MALFCAFLLAFALNASVNTKPVMPPTVAKEHMEHWLIDRPWQVAGEAKLGDANLLQSFYYARDYQPVWLDGYELKPAARDLLAALRETAADDWRRYDYRVNTLLREASQLTNLPRQATAVDILLTDAFISYAREVFNRQLLPDMGEGDHPVKKVSQEFIEASQVGSDEVLNRLAISLQNRELESLVQQLTPQHQGYLALRQQLNLYFSIANSGHWKPMNQLAGLQQGQQHPDLAQLRWLLTKTGDISLSAWSFTQPTELLPPDHESSQWSDEFDDMLVAGIRRFQSRFGLKESGELTPETISWLNVPPYQIAQKIALNMKRWRHLPEDLGRRYVMVNMANYQLEYVEDDDVELEMKVIIGKLSRRTPVMVDTIRQMELAPTWGVPHRIAVQYLLPKFRRNPSYIHQKGFRIIQRIDGEDRFVTDPLIRVSAF